MDDPKHLHREIRLLRAILKDTEQRLKDTRTALQDALSCFSDKSQLVTRERTEAWERSLWGTAAANPYGHGYDAAGDLEDVGCCPFPAWSEKHALWTNGWADWHKDNMEKTDSE